MKKSLSFTLLGTALAAATPDARALDWRGYYLDLDAGGVMQQELKIKSDVTSTSGKMKFGTGFRGDIGFGGRFSDSFQAGILTGVLWNSIDKIQSDSVSGSSLMQVPVMANVTYRLPLEGKWIPYVSGAAGGVMSVIDVKSSLATMRSSDFVFAYQAEVGVKYVASKSIEWGLSYRFLSTLDHDWSDAGVTLKTDGSISHSLVAIFTWKF
ncbi:MAG TPA: outer membrane beta-barrel protein [Candidatus Paceibacterota bacterium]|nr:outer membrane beta-barrel protein [Candidatus Paceibacterota bacterium]